MNDNERLLKKESQFFSQASRVKYYNIVIRSGSGAVVTDVDGNDYIDLLASASSTNTGHAHPHIVKAIQDQAASLIQYTSAYFATENEANLAPRLAALAPISGPKALSWGNSGSDANDAIIKFSRAYTGRPNIVSFTGAYHGSTYGSQTLSSVSLNMSRKIGPMLPSVVKVPFPDTKRKLKNETDDEFVDRIFSDFKLPFETYLPAEETAAILIEPIQGDSGIVKTPQKFMEKIYKFAHDNGILFAVDEVNQGMGRTGKWWSIDNFGLDPDLMSVGKSLASGMPLSAVIGRKNIMDSLNSPGHLFTTAGNPITTAAAMATIDVIEDEHLIERSAKLGKVAEKFFLDERKKFPFIGDIRMYGLNGGIDIVNQETGEADADATKKIIYRAFELGVIIISLKTNILRFQPPLVITEPQLKKSFIILDQSFRDLDEGKIILPDNTMEMGWS